MRIRRLISVAAVTFAAFSAVFAADYSYYSYDTGSLLQSSVSSVLRPGRGPVWACSKEGLLRIANSDIRLISDFGSEILGIASTDASVIWALTPSALLRYDTASDSFTTACSGADVIQTIGSDLFVCCGDSLLFSRGGTADLQFVARIPSDEPFRATSITKFNSSHLIISGSAGKSYVFDTPQTTFIPLEADFSNTVALLTDSQGYIWRACAGRGLERYNTSLELINSFNTSNSSISSDDIVCLAEVDGHIWAGTDGQGINVIDCLSCQVSVLRNNPEDKFSLPSDSVVSLYYSTEARALFAGTASGSVFAAKLSNIHSLSLLNPATPLYCPAGILDLFQVPGDKSVWISTNGAGLVSYDIKNASFKACPATQGQSFSSSAPLDRSRVLLYSHKQGFSLYDIDSETLSDFAFPDIDSTFVQQSSDLKLCRVESGNIAVSGSHGMFIYSPEAGVSDQVSLSSVIPDSQPITPVKGSEAARFFHNAHQLLSLDAAQPALSVLAQMPDSVSISCAVMEGNDIIWVATDRALYLYGLWSQSLQLVSEEMQPYSGPLLSDMYGRVWLGCSNRMTLFNPGSRSFCSIDETDGLPSLCCPAPCSLQTSDGYVLFACEDAIHYVDPYFSQHLLSDEECYIIQLDVDGKSVTPANAATISTDHNSVVLHLFTSEDTFRSNCKYRVKVSRHGRDLFFESDGSEVNLGSLLQGDYSISASTQTKYFTWSNWKEIAVLKVKGRFMSPVTIIIIVVVIALLALFFILRNTVSRTERGVRHSSQKSKAEETPAPAEEPEPKVDYGLPPTPSYVTEENAPAGGGLADVLSDDSGEEVSLITDLSDASILIVEDDLDLQYYLKSELEDSVKDYLQAYNGLEAINVLNQKHVDIIVSDVMMPEMDGFALCRYVKTTVAFSHIPVILLTARSDEASRVIGYKKGADDYITKPFDLNHLISSINTLFLSRQSVREKIMESKITPDVKDTTFSSADEKFMTDFDALIEANIKNPDLGVTFVVDELKMSRTVLFNKVKYLTGMNLQNYINKRRMEYVIHLMKTTNLSLAEIAEEAGFSSPRYFSTSFKNFTGMTPSQYKKDKL